jgi:hypothetical protein
VACINLQVYRRNAGVPRLLQDCRHERSTNTALPAIRRDIKLLESSDRAAVLGAQNRGDIGNTNNSATIPCQHEETAPHVCDRNVQYAGQGIWRRLDAMLSELVD